MMASRFFIVFGILLLLYSGYLIWQRYNPWRLSFVHYTDQLQIVTPNNAKLPSEITIADLKIRLPIKASQKDGQKWPAFNDAVAYLSTSPIPGENGNSILYGHNWHNLLGGLTKAKIGQEIVIRYTDGSTKNFFVKSIQEVTPDQTSILNPSNDTRITLYTCSGFLDSKRFVVVATI